MRCAAAQKLLEKYSDCIVPAAFTCALPCTTAPSSSEAARSGPARHPRPWSSRRARLCQWQWFRAQRSSAARDHTYALLGSSYHIALPATTVPQQKLAPLARWPLATRCAWKRTCGRDGADHPPISHRPRSERARAQGTNPDAAPRSRPRRTPEPPPPTLLGILASLRLSYGCAESEHTTREATAHPCRQPAHQYSTTNFMVAWKNRTALDELLRGASTGCAVRVCRAEATREGRRSGKYLHGVAPFGYSAAPPTTECDVWQHAK